MTSFSAWSASQTGSFSVVSEESSVKVEDVAVPIEADTAESSRAELPLFTPRRVIQTAVVVLALLVGIYFLFPKLVGLGTMMLVSVVVMARKGVAGGRKTAIPFGPFLAFGGIVAMLVGSGLMDSYLSTF